jgi:hypothetical protein
MNMTHTPTIVAGSMSYGKAGTLRRSRGLWVH